MDDQTEAITRIEQHLLAAGKLLVNQCVQELTPRPATGRSQREHRPLYSTEMRQAGRPFSLTWLTERSLLGIMHKGFFPGTLFLLAALLLSTYQLRAADYYVGVDGGGFSPASLTIEVGDTVIWVNNDEFFPHTTTSDLDILDPNYWHYVLAEQDETFSLMFNTPGTFSYHDQADIGTGTITVNPPSVMPIITLESPRVADGQFLFEATGLTAGKTNVLLVSTNLTSWTAIQTNVAAASSLTFTNATSPGAQFFQVVEQP